MRQKCSCGRYHERFDMGGGAWVTGCATCLSEPDAMHALQEIVKAAKTMCAATPTEESDHAR